MIKVLALIKCERLTGTNNKHVKDMCQVQLIVVTYSSLWDKFTCCKTVK